MYHHRRFGFRPRRAIVRDDVLRAAPGQSLSLDEMRARLPAIFAEAPHESRSDRYVYIPTHNLLEGLIKEGFEPVEARVSKAREESRKGFTKHMVRFRAAGQKMTAVGDTSFEAVMRNAHDGTAAYDFMAGLFRLACLNGMVVSDGEFASAHVRHSGNRDKQLTQVIDAVYSVVKEAPKVLEAPRLWASIPLRREEQMAMAESARTIRFGDAEGNVDTPIRAEQLLFARRPADDQADLWSTFNRIQENVIRGGLSAHNTTTHRRSTTREVRGIDADIKLNKALWQLGTKMAELKA